MIVRPKIRGFICTTAHPTGCAKNVQNQIDYVKSKPPVKDGPKKVLVIGASNGYGLASRIVSAFGSGAATIGVFFERGAEGKRTATAGWYNSVAFDKAAKSAGLFTKSINGDAFSDEIKRQVIDVIKADLGQVDMVVYSLASPRRQDPKTDQLYKSVLKPKDKPYTNKSFDFSANKLESITLEPATDEEIQNTVKVMGGEDWELWMEQLEKEGCLADNVTTVAYSYIGPELTMDIYRNGTIGAAKDHLEQMAKTLDARLNPKGGRAYISVNKALVTQSSSAIPFIPLYFTLLKRVLKEKGLDEDCIQQMYCLFAERLYTGDEVSVDEAGRIRVDDCEMREDVQSEVDTLWKKITEDNVAEIADIEGYNSDFLKLFGFGLSGVDYEQDVDPNLPLE